MQNNLETNRSSCEQQLERYRSCACSETVSQPIAADRGSPNLGFGCFSNPSPPIHWRTHKSPIATRARMNTDPVSDSAETITAGLNQDIAFLAECDFYYQSHIRGCALPCAEPYHSNIRANSNEKRDAYQCNAERRVSHCHYGCLLYTSPSPRDRQKSRMPSSA